MKLNSLPEKDVLTVLSLMSEGDQLLVRYNYSDGSYPRLIIVPSYSVNADIQRYDLAALLEYTLHLALDADMSETDLWYHFGFITEEEAKESFDEETVNDYLTSIDLGYYILTDIFALETVE